MKEKNNRIIVISGNKGVGKDTVADIICELTNYQYEKFSFASPIKEIASIILDDNVEKLDICKELLLHDFNEILPINMTTRQLYQKIGDTFAELFGKDIFVKVLIHKLTYSNEFVVISDMRFLHEYEIIKHFNPIFIRVKTENYQVDTSHYSETDLISLPDTAFDEVILNEKTINELTNDIRQILKKYSIYE